MRRQACTFILLAALGPAAHAAAPKEDKVDGYLEWRLGDVLVADGQKIRATPTTKFKGKGDAKDLASIPMGYEVKAKGLRDDAGVLVARELEAKPNGSAMFEGDVRSATDAAEQRSVQAGRFLEGEGASARQRRPPLHGRARGGARPAHRERPVPALPGPRGSSAST